jgi:membrane-associated protease RseP (regulator of RpoE activity)
MSLYNRFKNEAVVGGAVGTQSAPEISRSRSVLAALVFVGLLVWLGITNPWTLIFVIGLLISILLHEVGHFVTARRTGMKVTQFFMGFGPRLWSTQRGEVEYGARALPLGAFVRIIGMNVHDEVDAGDEVRAYRNKSFPRQLLVITAGSLMHVIIALLLFMGIYTVSGRYQETGDVLIGVPPAAGSPAEEAGLQEGDIIVTAGGLPVETRNELVSVITAADPGEILEITYVRDGVQATTQATLAPNPANPEIGYLGVATSSADYVKQSIPQAMWHSVGDVVTTAGNSIKGVVIALNPFNSIRALQDPDANPEMRPTTVVGASQIGGQLGDSEGLKGVLLLLASVNVFVGVFNMFPLLPFDGGHAAIATYERLRSAPGKRYRADVNKMIPFTTVVMVLLGFLLFAGLYLDITNPF